MICVTSATPLIGLPTQSYSKVLNTGLHPTEKHRMNILSHRYLHQPHNMYFTNNDKLFELIKRYNNIIIHICNDEVMIDRLYKLDEILTEPRTIYLENTSQTSAFADTKKYRQLDLEWMIMIKSIQFKHINVKLCIDIGHFYQIGYIISKDFIDRILKVGDLFHLSGSDHCAPASIRDKIFTSDVLNYFIDNVEVDVVLEYDSNAFITSHDINPKVRLKKSLGLI